MREFELTTSVAGSHSAGDRQLTYDVVIGEGWFLHADALVAPDDYEKVSAIQTAMLESLEVLEIPAP